ncbi:putative ankyrin repeat domain containing protein [Colletotrichum karsti]|uniref:Ankyrin repeat domain containing protein n=1 Tax=Colletotrichum karsti TaxID=1095194 RepID=A0A9P6I2C4_9PEZI|nr:putative ankyrin repeat domain containing protein [Colletotrichum karsti]KAF9875682.1 putative ankyrin repeat domain containing protein [Colletotrichum karsti]
MPGRDCTQEDMELWEELMCRKEDRKEKQRAALRRDHESHFAHLAPLPPPLPKSSLWFALERRPEKYRVPGIRPFLVACHDGSLDDVKDWLVHKRDILRPIGLRDGLVCAALRDQVEVARYLLDECRTTITSMVIGATCNRRSLPLFQLCVEHGYHPDQSIPSNDGGMGTALENCLDNAEVVRFLLEYGADPDISHSCDNRCMNWGLRSAPLMDRSSGLCLDRTVRENWRDSMELLLSHGANPNLARPLNGIVLRRFKIQLGRLGDSETLEKYDWLGLMKLFIRHGADVNKFNYGGGTALTGATGHGWWDMVEYLLEQGADPRIKKPVTNRDAFETAAEKSGTAWDSEMLKDYVAYLCDDEELAHSSTTLPVPDEARSNPLAQIIEKMKTRSGGKHRD